MAFRKAASAEEQRRYADANGLPYWAEAKNYAGWDRLSMDQLRWEFLRRTREYSDDWNSCLQNPLVVTQLNNKWRGVSTTGIDPVIVARKYGMSELIMPALTWSNLPDDFKFYRSQFEGGRIVYPDEPCPFTDEYDQYHRNLAGAKNVITDSIHFPNWYHGKVWIEFDLASDPELQLIEASKNLKQAIKDAAHFMDHLKSPTGTYQDDDYVPQGVWTGNPRIEESHYLIGLLRIWDAAASGATQKDIANEIGDELSDEVDKTLSENAVGKRYSVAQAMWRRL